MVAENDQPSIPGRRLAERLRGLREREHLTQKQLARVLGGSEPLSIATVSLWEKPGSDRLPPPQRLDAYARLFCTRRSFESDRPRLLRSNELTEQEQEQATELYEELIALRERAVQSTNVPAVAKGQRSSIWHFRNRTAVSIVDSVAPDAPLYADQAHLNYSQYARFADLDALIAVFAQVKADNPVSMIRLLSPDELTKDFALNHLVIVGGAAWREVSKETPWFAQNIDIVLPVAQPAGETYVFECTVGEEKRTFKSLYVGGVLTQDIGLIARVPHPIMPEKTITVLSGITSRGVHGAMLCFADWHVKDENERYLQETFGDTEAFCVLMNIPVANNMALPTNLWLENARVYEWSTETGAGWGDHRDEN